MYGFPLGRAREPLKHEREISYGRDVKSTNVVSGNSTSLLALEPGGYRVKGKKRKKMMPTIYDRSFRTLDTVESKKRSGFKWMKKEESLTRRA